LVRAQEQRIAISSRGVEQILPPAAGELGRLGEYQTYKVGETAYEAVQFEALLHLKKPAEAAGPRPALLVRDSAGVVRAVLVDEVLESRTLVVKSISEYVPKLRGIAGATILGDGSVAPVIDLEALVREPVVEPAQKVSSITGTSEPTARQRLRALVVDDSLSARRSMTQFLEDAGFEVESALDGLDAVAELEKALPDILLVDLEMPRMNGLELTRHVRGNATTQQLPVVMVTSRSTGKHRHEAEAAGVSAYVNKPFAEDDLLRIISELTALRGAA
jgi:CheY-like chemotaxis protein